jgi:hypothetical protein
VLKELATFEAETARRRAAAFKPDSAIVEMLLIKGSLDRWSGHHLMHALHKQVSMSVAEFQPWGQRVVYYSVRGFRRISHDGGPGAAPKRRFKPTATSAVSL